METEVEQRIDDGENVTSSDYDVPEDDEPRYIGIKTGSNVDVYESRVKKLGDVLGRPYKVPDYQRPYTWKVKLANDLWLDVISRYIENDDSKSDGMPMIDEYLLGPVVFAKENNAHHIVDGQQRLVTLTLLFCAMRDAVKTFDIERTTEDHELFKNFTQNINKSVINDNNDAWIELNTFELNAAYRHIAAGKPLKKLSENIKKDSDAARLIGNYRKLFRNAREFCARLGLENTGVKLINHLNKLFEITTDIKSKNVFIHITIEDDTWAPHVFESLNGKSKPLTPSELIKSYLLHTTRVGGGDPTSLATKWTQITNEFKTKTTSTIDDLLYESALSRRIQVNDEKGFAKFYQSKITQKHLYGHLKYACKTKNDVRSYIDHLNTDVQNIIYVLRPDTLQESYPANLKHALASISLLKASYIRRPIVAACREWGIQNKHTATLANWLHQYFFVEVRVLEQKIDRIKQISSSVVERINGGETLLDILENQDIFNPTRLERYDVDFKNKFPVMFKNPIKTLDTAKYILVCIERHLSPHSEISIHAHKIELEHIFPKNPQMSDGESLGTDLSREHQDRLGNLTILTPPYNRDVANKNFLMKKGTQNVDYNCYAKSKLRINIDHLMKYDKWCERELIDRENSLCGIANDAWQLTGRLAQACSLAR